jgi:hypothetical protein
VRRRRFNLTHKNFLILISHHGIPASLSGGCIAMLSFLWMKKGYEKEPQKIICLYFQVLFLLFLINHQVFAYWVIWYNSKLALLSIVYIVNSQISWENYLILIFYNHSNKILTLHLVLLSQLWWYFIFKKSWLRLYKCQRKI